MTEKEILEKIEASAHEAEIPESIRPEQMKKRLKSQQRKRRYFQRTAAAAVLLLGVVSVGGVQAYISGNAGRTQNTRELVVSDASNVASDRERSAADGIGENTGAAETEAGENSYEAKRDAGELYVVAKDYGEVYDAVTELVPMARTEGNAMGESSVDISYTDGNVSGDVVYQENSLNKTEAIREESASGLEDGTGENTFSGTNLQTEGVDESDIIKTDGSYIYAVSENRVVITDIREGVLQEAGEIDLSDGNASGQVLELYVNGDILNVVVQAEQIGLSEEDSGDGEDVYYIDSQMQTEVRTYDISNPGEPKLKGSITQDGYYQTSRKIGDVVYLFTCSQTTRPVLEREEAITDEETGGWIPIINGETASADHIYLSERGGQELIVTSVDVNKPDKVVDYTVILNNYVDIYVSTKAFYLYQTNYSENGSTTQIAKFGFEQGNMNAVGAASANGSVMDTFAVNEYGGCLRLLTTAGNTITGDASNNLYLFDEDLKLTGKLEGMAEGEEIYAARYLGDMAYFVTYRNTDPLFAVDLSDIKNPELVGELKITGFSEYLHFWGEDKLVGIGYETDPDTGEQKGIKLTMFDISNPTDLKEEKSVVLTDADYSQALYNYKCVLADSSENLFGFTTETYGNTQSLNYRLFSWEDGTFRELLDLPLDGGLNAQSYRGIYAGDYFYLVSPSGITSYDRENDYTLSKELKF